MRVRALVSFAGKGMTVARGAEFDLPEGVDWLQAGLVAPVETGPAPHMFGVERAVDTRPLTAELRADAPVSSIDGIGPVTASRLAAAQIRTVGDLLAADPGHVALIASVKQSVVDKWRAAAEG